MKDVKALPGGKEKPPWGSGVRAEPVWSAAAG